MCLCSVILNYICNREAKYMEFQKSTTLAQQSHGQCHNESRSGRDSERHLGAAVCPQFEQRSVKDKPLCWSLCATPALGQPCYAVCAGWILIT